MTTEDLQNELWDYVYGLLEADEALALQRRITSEPLVARAYAEVRQQADLINAAARVETAPIALRRPTTKCAQTVMPRSLQVARWAIGLATAVLVMLTAATAWQCQWMRNDGALAAVDSDLAAKQVRLFVSGPTQVQLHSTNYFTVQATNLLDQPVSTEVEYALKDGAGNTLREASLQCEVAGTTLALTEDSLASAVEVCFTCPSDGPDQAVRYALTPAVDRFQTQLVTDRTTYQNGDTVFFRSVTLPTTAPEQTREFNLNYLLVPPPGQAGTPLVATGLTELGTGNGSVHLGDQWPTGRYALVAQSAGEEFAPCWQWFEINPPQPQRQVWNKELTLGKRLYMPGEAVELKLAATNEQGQPASELKLKVATKLSGEEQKLAEQVASTDASGKSTFNLQLPQDAPNGMASVQVELSDGVQTECVMESFQIAGSQTEDLIRLNRPTAPTDHIAGMTISQKVLDSEANLFASVTNRDPQSQLVLSASCRGTTVGQAILASAKAEQDVELALAPEAAGVLDVDLYDYRQQPPTLLAKEQLYRRPKLYWNVAASRQGENTWDLQVTDEQQRGGQAVLGVRVVAEDTATDNPPLANDYYFAHSAPSDRDFDGADFLLRDPVATSNVTAHFAKLLPESFGVQANNQWGLGAEFKPQDSGSAAPAPVQVRDNLAAITARYQSAATSWRESSLNQLRSAAQFLVVGALVLLLALTMLGVLRLAGDAKVWAPLMVAAAGVLFVSGRWLSAELDLPSEVTIASRTTPLILAALPQIEAEHLDGRQLNSREELSSANSFGRNQFGMHGPILLPLVDDQQAMNQYLNLYVYGDTSWHDYALPALQTQNFSYYENGAQATNRFSSLGTFHRQVLPPANWGFRPPLRAEYFGEQSEHSLSLARRYVDAKFPVQWYAASSTFSVVDEARRVGNRTAYWNPLLKTDKEGRVQVQFTSPADGKRHFLIVDAHGQGRLGTLRLPLPAAASRVPEASQPAR